MTYKMTYKSYKNIICTNGWNHRIILGIRIIVLSWSTYEKINWPYISDRLILKDTELKTRFDQFWLNSVIIDIKVIKRWLKI